MCNLYRAATNNDLLYKKIKVFLTDMPGWHWLDLYLFVNLWYPATTWMNGGMIQITFINSDLTQQLSLFCLRSSTACKKCLHD